MHDSINWQLSSYVFCRRLREICQDKFCHTDMDGVDAFRMIMSMEVWDRMWLRVCDCMALRLVDGVCLTCIILRSSKTRRSNELITFSISKKPWEG